MLVEYSQHAVGYLQLTVEHSQLLVGKYQHGRIFTTRGRKKPTRLSAVEETQHTVGYLQLTVEHLQVMVGKIQHYILLTPVAFNYF